MQIPEYVAQGVITVLLLLTGKWVTGLLSLVLTAYHVRAYLRQEHQVGLSVYPGLCPLLTAAHHVKSISECELLQPGWLCRVTILVHLPAAVKQFQDSQELGF